MKETGRIKGEQADALRNKNVKTQKMTKDKKQPKKHVEKEAQKKVRNPQSEKR